MKLCKISGCDRLHEALGFCNMHYLRFKSRGDAGGVDPERVKGGWSISTYGYKVRWRGSTLIFQHREVMESHIGRKLTSKEVVHHIDRNRLENEIENLMLLPDQAAHRKQHKLEDAFRATGCADSRRCFICKEYDSKDNLLKQTGNRGWLHKACRQKKNAEYRRKKKCQLKNAA